MSDSEIKLDTFPNQKKVHVLAGLPEYLKDPAHYEKIQKALYDAGGSTCTHSEIIEWAGCVKCQSKQRDRAEMMRRFGFKNGQQYLAWCKVHQAIRDKVIFPKYNTPK